MYKNHHHPLESDLNHQPHHNHHHSIKIVIMMIIREWVVTAAHCMKGENWRKLKVVLGELDRRDKYETENR